MSSLPIIKPSFESRYEFQSWLSEQPGGVVVKFTADWCGPCQRVAPLIEEWHSRLSTRADVQFVHLDVDENFDVFALMKSKKLVPAIPCLVYYRGGKAADILAPEHIVVGAAPVQINSFFNQIARA